MSLPNKNKKESVKDPVEISALLLLFSSPVMSDSLQPHGLWHDLSLPHHLPKSVQIHVHCIGDASQLSYPLMPSSPSALNISQYEGLFQWVSYLHQMTKILEFQLQHQSFQQVFRVDFLVWSPCCSRDFQESLQHCSSKASILWCSAFCMVQLPQLYVNTGEIIDLTIRTFVGRVMSLVFNTLSRFVIALLPRNKCPLTSWMQSPSTVILELKKRKSVTTFIFPPSICHEVMGPDAMILVF